MSLTGIVKNGVVVLENGYQLPENQRVAVLVKNDTTTLADRFRDLAKTWKTGRGPTSSSKEMALHSAYQQIIGLGAECVPLLLAELERTPDHWFWALRSITGENPVRPEHRGKLALMAKDWIDWGRGQGYRW